jgi:hypothetical protein
MGKSSPKPPKAPDPEKTAQAQAAANKETAISQAQLNMVNQYTPQGSLQYEQRGTGPDGTPLYSATTTLSPEQQRLFDLQNQAGQQYGETANQQLSQVRDRLSTPLDYSSLGEAPQANQQAWDTAYNSLIQRQQPQSDQRLSALETRLANQGIGYGTDAWKAAMDDYNRGQTDFNLAAQLAATGEMGQRFGMDSMARDRSINEMIQQRQIPLNELNAMLSGTQVQNPNFVGTPQTGVQPADIMGATYASANLAQNNYMAQMQGNSAQNQGLFGLIGAGANAYAMNPGAFSFSDIRLKKNINRVGTHPLGVGVYDFEYVWGEKSRGVMAQEVLSVKPEAVAIHESGYLMVDYGAL